MKKNVLITIFALLLLPVIFSSFSLANEDFTTIYPEDQSTEIEEEDFQEEEEEIIEDEESIEEDTQAEETIIDEYTRSTKNIYFDLVLERGHQTPFGKFVPYTLTITPHIDSPRTQILWNTPSTLESRPRHREFVSLESGETYTFRGRVRPLRAGAFDFSVSVISWQPDTNYTNSISDNIVFNNNLVLQPVSSHYQILNVLRFLLIILGFAGIIALTIFFIKKNVPKAKKWLTPPDW